MNTISDIKPPLPEQKQDVSGHTSTVKAFRRSYPIGRPAQPEGLATAYVMLATDGASDISGATIAVTGSRPIL